MAEKELNGMRIRQVQLDSGFDARRSRSAQARHRTVEVARGVARWFKAKAYMRKHIVEMDEPDGLDATDSAASAHEQLLSAVGSCVTVGFVLNATKRGVKVHDLEIALEGNFENILKWAGHAPDGNPAYPSIKAKCFVRADADEKTLREIWKAAVDGSPVTQTVARPTEIITDFEKV